MKSTIAPPEAHEQIAVFAWIDMQKLSVPDLRMAFHVPNGEHRNPITGARLKRLGVRAGVPDILLPVARGMYNGLAIELKRQVGGRLSPEQKAWIEGLKLCGWDVHVCPGADVAIEAIRKYLDIQ